MQGSQTARAHALSDLIAAQQAMPGLDDIRRLLESATPPPAVLSGLRHILAEQMGICTAPDAAGTADLLRWLLRLRPGPVTPLAERLAGRPARVETIPGSEQDRQLTAGEALRLGLRGPGRPGCWERSGLMIAGTTVIARVRLVIVPDQVGDDEAIALIRKGAPCGTVLPGLARLWRQAAVCWPADPAVVSKAVLHTEGCGFGFAGERFTAGFTARVADLAA